MQLTLPINFARVSLLSSPPDCGSFAFWTKMDRRFGFLGGHYRIWRCRAELMLDSLCSRSKVWKICRGLAQVPESLLLCPDIDKSLTLAHSLLSPNKNKLTFNIRLTFSAFNLSFSFSSLRRVLISTSFLSRQ